MFSYTSIASVTVDSHATAATGGAAVDLPYDREQGSDEVLRDRMVPCDHGSASCIAQHTCITERPAVSQGPLLRQEHSEVRRAEAHSAFYLLALQCATCSASTYRRLPAAACFDGLRNLQPSTAELTRFDCPQMASLKEAVKPGVEEAAPVHRIRITLSSRNVKNLEKGKYPRPPPHLIPRASTPFALSRCCSILCAPFLESSRSCINHHSLEPLSASALSHSVRRPHPRREGEAAQGQGSREAAHQGAAHHHPQGARRQRYQYVGPF